MKIGLNIVGVILALIGLVWVFQGVGVIKGSFMTGQSMWAAIGVAAVVIGAVLLFYNNRRGTQS